MSIFLDTNILISFINTTDLFHTECKEILSKNHLNFIVGLLNLIEYRCVMNRMITEKNLKFDLALQKILNPLTAAQQIENLTEYIIAKIPLKIVTASTIENLQILEETYSTENGLILAYKLAKEIPVKTLDLMQICSALKIKFLSQVKIDLFLTNDKMMLDKKEIILKKTKIQLKSSQELRESLE